MGEEERRENHCQASGGKGCMQIYARLIVSVILSISWLIWRYRRLRLITSAKPNMVSPPWMVSRSPLNRVSFLAFWDRMAPEKRRPSTALRGLGASVRAL